MANDSQSQVDNFFSFFEARLESVKLHHLDQVEGMMLLCSYIDSLSGYMYGGSSNANRFKRFLFECTEQGNTWRKVSLILLRQYLEKKNLTFYDDIVQVLNRLHATTSNFFDLNHNPDISVEELMNECHKHMSIDRVRSCSHEMKRFEYSTIFWNAYRNATVHETSIRLNQAMNLAGQSVPYYSNEHLIEDGKVTSSTTRFAIPPSFLVTTIESGLSFLRNLVSSGELTLRLSRPYDEPAAAAETHKINQKKKEESEKYPRMITKPFQPLLADVESLLNQATDSHKLFESTGNENHKWRSAAMSRSAIVSSIFFLESFINCIVADFRVREIYQLPDKILRKAGLLYAGFDRIPLIERVYVTPYICSSDEGRIDQGFFDKGSSEFQLLQELIDIRDGFAHSHPVQRKLKLTRTTTGQCVADDKFEENFWPRTKIPKDIFTIGCSHAKEARRIIRWVIQKLDEFLKGRITSGDWMKSERIEFDPNK